MPSQQNGPLPQPSRLVLNVGILIGGLIGLSLSLFKELDSTQAFIITGICCLIGAGVLSYADVFFRRYQQSKK